MFVLVSLIDELKRRNVLRVAAAYTVTAWLIIQVAETIFPQYGLQHHVRTVITVLAIGFVPAVILAWTLEWTPKGIRLDAGLDAETDGAAAVRASRKFDRIVIVILTVALAWFVYDKLVPSAPNVKYSIAVLPFSNESPDTMPDYLADGLGGEVRNLLAKLPQLLVIERSSAYSFKGKDVTTPEIGSRLGVSHLLTGAVTQLGSGIRIRAQLLDATAGESLWSRAYTGTLNEIFAIQDAIASDIILELQLEDESSLPQARRTDPDVLALTLQARQLWYEEMDGSGEEMATLLQQALAIDPNYTPAMVWMVYANWELRREGLINREEENQRWLKLAARILAIEPENAYVHNMFGWEALYVNHDVAAAASSYARALNSEPNDAEILRTAARFAMLIGHEDDALAMIDRSVALDPVCSLCLYHASKYYMYAGQVEKAESLRQRFVTLHDGGHFEYGLIKLLLGKADEARVVFEELQLRMEAPEVQNDGRAHAGLAMAYFDLERQRESDEQLAILIEGFGDDDPRGVAAAYAWRNQKDAAFEWLERYRAQDDPGQTLLLLDPAFRNLRDDPRWKPLRESLGFSEQALATLDFPVDLLTQYHE